MSQILTPEEQLKSLAKKNLEFNCESIAKLPASGSYRQYYRLWGENRTIIGVYNEDKAENKAFLSFTRHFLEKGLPVPQILAEALENNIYLLEDLGDVTLLSHIQQLDYPQEVKPEVIAMYKRVLEELPRFQVLGGEGLDYSNCYPRHAFDRQSMMWDLNYFKYYFLKLARVPFDEQALENDFNTFCDYLLSADCNHFLYRDFQSRNVMIHNEKPYFIDYQGGRKGALHYDIASVLFEAKTSLLPDVREELLDHYLQSLNKLMPVSKDEFLKHFYGYVYIRLMQAMGAYGFRGLYEKKELFLQSIPLALNHLDWLLDNVTLPVDVPELRKVWEYLTESDYIRQLAKNQLSLRVAINSFSYRRGIPVDESSNGGGFVFDCRSVHNPGRYEQYKMLTGKDEPVQEFFRNEPEMDDFLENVTALVDRSVEKYLSRGFTSLMINFGCTGGQHRSVYSAEQLYKHLSQKFRDSNVIFKLRHRELEVKGW
ncbi:MAG: RNase adapter RapZ [Bacteroidota bacterium]|nr:RNase adapter RapZ [Bacteroidota bacterium]